MHEETFSIFGTNANGLLGKLDSLKSNISFFKNPTCINIQETKLRFHGQVKLDGYQIFESVRTGMGGGLLTAVSQDIEPVLISTGNENIEMIVVQGRIGKYNIRMFNCYGPQEVNQSQRPKAEQEEIVTSFWIELEKEIIKAKDDDVLVVVQMDANAKVGKDYIKDDPNYKSDNGRLLLGLVERQNLRILNSSNQCLGVVTRDRIAGDNHEKSVIDYIITCDTLADFLDEMIIDDDRLHVLTKYASKKKVESDHNVMVGKFSLKYTKKKSIVRREVFNFKDKEAQKYFYEQTNISTKFKACFSDDKTIEQNVNKYYKTLDDTFHHCFKKVRIKSKNSEAKDESKLEIQKLLTEKQQLQLTLKIAKCKLAKTFLVQYIENLETKISEKVSDSNAKKVTEHVGELNCLNGKFNQSGLWKLKSKLCPKAQDPPMAKRDYAGNLVTAPELLKRLYADTYEHRLRHRKIAEKYSDILCKKSELWARRLRHLKVKVTNPWSMANLEKVLKSLKTNQARDPLGMINELFKPGIIGTELKVATLRLMNSVKSELFVPYNMQLCNITTIYKSKGSRLDMSSDRGIFILPVLRKILDKLTYLDKYPELDMAMSDSNIGARTKIFVITFS